MNSTVVWNHSNSFYCNDPSFFCGADGRKVINHEFGHAEGLAHEPANVNSVMRQGALSDYHVQLYDRNGIIQIYGAYP
jgi:hypothetical protein